MPRLHPKYNTLKSVKNNQNDAYLLLKIIKLFKKKWDFHSAISQGARNSSYEVSGQPNLYLQLERIRSL